MTSDLYRLEEEEEEEEEEGLLMDDRIEGEDEDEEEGLVMVWDYGISNAMRKDDKEAFILFLEKNKEDYASKAQYLLGCVVSYRSIKCAGALIKGKLITINLNCSFRPDGMHPLHQLARWSRRRPSMMEFFLVNEADPDIPFIRSSSYSPRLGIELYENMLPLQIALEDPLIEDWTPKDSVEELILLLCLPKMQDELETIALLAGKTKATGEIFLDYANQGKVIELAALLMVALKRVYNVMDRVHQCFDSLLTEEDQREKVLSMRHLVEIFDKAGEEISAYVKKDRCNISKRQTFVDVKRLLEKFGFHLQQSDLKDASFTVLDHLDEVRRCLDDFDMAHYSKSGFRWKVSEEDPSWKFINAEAYIDMLKNEAKALKEESINVEKQQQRLSLPIEMDYKVLKVVEKDDKEEFLSVIECCSRKQHLLYLVCVFGSIKCAEALLKGETCVTVDLNEPCTDTGLYPLHCAALSLLPSITELFLYYGARTNVRVTFRCPSDICGKQLLEQQTDNLPIHMALLGITCLPCISEWTPDHSIYNLVAILCLPRMQNPLETLDLLAGTLRKTRSIKEIQREFAQLAMDGKFVELAALLMVAFEDLRDVMCFYYNYFKHTEEENLELTEDNKIDAQSMILLLSVFRNIGAVIAPYIKEDKYNVTKHQAVEDVKLMLQQANLSFNVSDIDLSIYKWFETCQLTH